MKKILLAAALLLAAIPAFAVGTNAHVSFVAPTQNTDGSALARTDIASFRILWTRVGQTTPLSSKSTATLNADVQLDCGAFVFTVATVNTAGTMGPESTPVNYDTGLLCVLKVPGPPTAVVVK